MASTVLPNGIIIPEKYSRDWYNDLYHNWQELDNLLGGGTPKDGTLTIQKNGDTVGTFSANQATNETINIEVPTVNDATLTIQKNGTTVDTFTANSSTDKTVNIAVPTKTSDLTNDSDFVQSSDLATVATSGSYNDLSNKPTIPTVNNATLTIQQNGTTVDTFTANASSNVTANITVPTKTSDLTNDSGFITSDTTKIPLAGSNQISGDLIPATTNAYDLGSSSYQWNNAYIKSLTINGVACGDILTHNVSEFVPVSGGNVMTGSLGPSTSGGASLGDSTHKWATLNDVDINNIGFPSTSGIDVAGSLTDYTSGQDVVGKYYITTVPGVASGRFFSSTALRFRLVVYKDYNEMAVGGDPICSLPLTESFEWESLLAPTGACILIKPESYIAPTDLPNTGWTLRIYPNKGL